MDTFTLETILSNLPTLLTLWSAFTLSWGMYVMLSFRSMIKFAKTYKCGCRPQDSCNVKFMMAANTIVGLFLVAEPMFATGFGDAVAVINTFYCAYLIPASVTIARWWFTKSTFACNQHKSIPDDHLLT